MLQRYKIKGRTRQCPPVYLPPCLLFFVITLHSQVQMLAHLVEEIGAALALASLDVRISVVKALRIDLHTEDTSEKSGQFVHGRFPVVDTLHLVQGVYQLDQLDGRTRPTPVACGARIAVMVQYIQLGVDIPDDDMQEANPGTVLRCVLFRDGFA